MASKASSAIGGVLAVALIGAVFFTRENWLPWIGGETAGPAAEEHHDHASPQRVKLTPQGRENLKLVSKPIVLQNYWRTLQVPGAVVDRPGLSDRGIPAPVAGVVAKVHAFPGDTVRPGDPLYTIRLISEYLQNTQTELFKTAQEIKLNQTQLARAKTLFQTGTLEESKVVELQNQDRRLTTQMQAYRQDLMTRGLTTEQINTASEGKFVNEVVILAPLPAPDSPHLVDDTGKEKKSDSPVLSKSLPVDFAYEVQELKVQLGEQVQAGQVLGVLANHRLLYIEGRGFKKEATMLERAAQNGWPVEAEFTEDDPNDWPPLEQPFVIRHLANLIDPTSRTFAFFIPLDNQSRAYQKNGRTFLVWRFRPGQRVRLQVPVEEFKNVIVLPVGAVVREGPEVYVFRQNGDAFDRKPVRLLFEDRRFVVIANDNSVSPGSYVAQNAAAALNRVLKSQQAGEGGHDAHAGHSH